jgi:hypothetical protein
MYPPTHGPPPNLVKQELSYLPLLQVIKYWLEEEPAVQDIPKPLMFLPCQGKFIKNPRRISIAVLKMCFKIVETPFFFSSQN